jgi:hypothetical protein
MMFVKNAECFIYMVIHGQYPSPVSSTNKSDHHNITEILMKMAVNTINLTLTLYLRGRMMVIDR